MALTIVVRSGDASSPPQITFDAPRVVIGRGDGCEVRLPDPSVSHRHASIRQRGTDYIVMDEGSTNGTFVGPVRLSPQAPRVLRSGDLVRVGQSGLEKRREQVPPTQNLPLATKELALSLVADALAALGEPALVEVRVRTGPDQGKILVIREFDRAYVAGRGKDLDLSLDDNDASRRHVAISRRGDHVYVRDLGSKNGSKLAGVALPADKDQLWPREAELELGQNRLSYADPALDALLELERSADERMRDDDSVDPPRVGATATEAPSEPPASSSEADRAGGRKAPIASVPSAKPAPVKRQRHTTDVLVALFALLVLAVSALGLLWLFRSD